MDMLEETLQKGLNPNEVADYFQSQSIAFLESRSDSLASAYGKTIPRSFDWAVCGNTLGQLRKDYNRAILVFKMLIKLYPLEYENYYHVGNYYKLKGATIEAVAYFAKSAELATDPEDKQEILALINSLNE